MKKKSFQGNLRNVMLRIDAKAYSNIIGFDIRCLYKQ